MEKKYENTPRINSKICNIPDDVEELTVEDTSIVDIYGVDLPSCLKKLIIKNARILNPEQVVFPDNLQTIELHNCEIENFFRLNLPSGLKNIYIYSLRTTCLDGVRLPAGLKSFKLRETHIQTIEGIEFPSELQVLDLSASHIEDLDGIDLPLNLKTLDLSGTNLRSVEGIKLPSRLQILKMSFCDLRSIPNNFFPSNLQILDLRGTSITKIPKLPLGLKKLNLSNSFIEEIAGIHLLSKLNELILCSSYIKSLDGVIFPSELKKLDLLNTDIESLEGIDLPSSLEILVLEDTYIKSIKGIRLPSELKVLNLGNTFISDLDKIVFPSKLQELNLYDTDIHSLDGVAFPDSLVRLNLRNLELDEIPMQIAKKRIPYYLGYNLAHIFEEYILIDGLKLKNQPLDMFVQNNHDLILDWYHQEKKNVYKAKVIFLGDGEAGKTYLIRRITNDGRKETDTIEDRQFFATDRTHGILIKEMDSKLPNGKDMHLSFWDFGGQQIMHSMHKVFLTQDTCYVLMVKTGTERQMEQARSWLRTVESVAPKAPIILLVNQVDRTGETIDERSLHEEYENLNFEIVRFNAKRSDEETIRQFEKKLLEKVTTLECCTVQVPMSWESIRNEISSRSRESFFIHQDDYHEICKRYALPDDHQIPLLNRLNVLGSCFSYHKDKDDTVFLEYKILNPEWFTNALYLIITKGQEYAAKKQGVLTHGEIKGILKHPEDGVSGELPFLEGVKYEPEHCEYILDIMHQHQQSYRTKDGDEFIPALCPTNKPINLEPEKWINANEDIKKEAQYKLTFKYLPETILHRLMIKYYGLLQKNKCWYNGMRIDYPDKDYCIIAESGKENETLSIRILTWGNANSNEFFPAFLEAINTICIDLGLKRPTHYVARYNDYKELKNLIKFVAKYGANETERFGDEKVKIIDVLNDYFMPQAIRQVIILQSKFNADPKLAMQANDDEFFPIMLAGLSYTERSTGNNITIKTEVNIDNPDSVVIKKPKKVTITETDFRKLFSNLQDHIDRISDNATLQIAMYLGDMIKELKSDIYANQTTQNQNYVDMINKITEIHSDFQRIDIPKESKLRKLFTDEATIVTLLGFVQQNTDALQNFIEFLKNIIS